MHMRKSISKLFVAGAIASTLAVFASGNAVAQTPITFQLNWVAGGANAGFAAALVEGYYKAAGLDVKVVEGNGSGNTAQMVAANQSQIAYADAVAISQLIAKGAPMKVLSTVYQSNPNAVLALKKANIKSVKDLAGKKVGVPSGSSQTTMLPLFLTANGLKESDLNLINMPPTSMVPSLLQGQVDAILGSIDAYQIQLEAQGATLDIYRFADHGVPTVSTSIFASNSYIKDNPEVVKKFIAASLKGWSFALDNPDKTVKDLKATFPNMNEKLAASELAAITPLSAAAARSTSARPKTRCGPRARTCFPRSSCCPQARTPSPTTPTIICRRFRRCARASPDAPARTLQ
jgi:NitT/TauT family transport system substrate-binding protein